MDRAGNMLALKNAYANQLNTILGIPNNSQIDVMPVQGDTWWEGPRNGLISDAISMQNDYGYPGMDKTKIQRNLADTIYDIDMSQLDENDVDAARIIELMNDLAYDTGTVRRL